MEFISRVDLEKRWRMTGEKLFRHAVLIGNMTPYDNTKAPLNELLSISTGLIRGDGIGFAGLRIQERLSETKRDLLIERAKLIWPKAHFFDLAQVERQEGKYCLRPIPPRAKAETSRAIEDNEAKQALIDFAEKWLKRYAKEEREFNASEMKRAARVKIMTLTQSNSTLDRWLKPIITGTQSRRGRKPNPKH